jgi:small GTP-binding protein
MTRIKVKVCLVGEMAVGKSSLIRRYVQDIYDDKYLSTLGVNVTRKSLELPSREGGVPFEFEMMIWDVMGLRGVHESYFHGAAGIVAVCDGTRRETLDALPGWVEDVRRVAGTPVIVIAVNKADLVDDSRIEATEIARLAESMGAQWLATSAKSGENIEELFRVLAERVLASILAGQPGAGANEPPTVRPSILQGPR